MKEQPRKYVTYFQNSNFKNKMKRLQIPEKACAQKIYVHEKILRIRDYRRNFIKKLLLEKRKENM